MGELKKISIYAKITKIESLNISNSIWTCDLIGHERSGYFYDIPEVWKPFIFNESLMINSHGGLQHTIDIPFITSTVSEILNSNNIKTLNSIYSIITVQEERDIKINKIIK
jgi:hypothetical protein